MQTDSVNLTYPQGFRTDPQFRYDQRVTRSRKEKRREYFYFLRFSTQTRIWNIKYQQLGTNL